MKFFNAVTTASRVGTGTVGELAAWLGKYVDVLFPENGIEYWSYGSGQGALRSASAVPLAGLAQDTVHHVACYVRGGSNEGQIIELALSLRDGSFRSLAWVKTFGRADECWQIARAVNEALNSMIFCREVPEIVSMADKLPRAGLYSRVTNLPHKVTVWSSLSSVLVETERGQVLDARSWADSHSAARVVADWVSVLTNLKAKFCQKAQPRLVVSDQAPGYVISDRGVEGCTGLYVLPPGGRPEFDSDYLGYYPDADSAIGAARDHHARHPWLVAA